MFLNQIQLFFLLRSKKMRGSGIDLDENELSKDGENSLSQSIFDDQTSSRTRKETFSFFDR